MPSVTGRNRNKKIGELKTIDSEPDQHEIRAGIGAERARESARPQKFPQRAYDSPGPGVAAIFLGLFVDLPQDSAPRVGATGHSVVQFDRLGGGLRDAREHKPSIGSWLRISPSSTEPKRSD